MAEISSRVLNMVRRRILQDPAVTNDVLFAAAVEIEPHMQDLSPRQFNARYPLRVRRWELSERTRIIPTTGPLSKAAADNPATPVAPRPTLTLSPSRRTDSAPAKPVDAAPPVRPAPVADLFAVTEPELVTASPEPERGAPAVTLPDAPPARRRRSRARPRPAEDARAEVMVTLLRWATAVGQATAIPEVFATLSTVDEYVDRIAEVLDLP